MELAAQSHRQSEATKSQRRVYNCLHLYVDGTHELSSVSLPHSAVGNGLASYFTFLFSYFVFFGYVIITIFAPSDFVVLSPVHSFLTSLCPLVSVCPVSLFYNTAMLFIHPSFLNTLKSTIPLWTCLICRFYPNRSFPFLPTSTLAALLAGIVIATVLKQISYLFVFFAILSAWSNTLFNVRSVAR